MLDVTNENMEEAYCIMVRQDAIEDDQKSLRNLAKELMGKV
jgi:hypothetical protein